MTVGMNQLNQMFRDFKVAEDVGKMMELRRFEVEYEIFGTVFWKDGKRQYLVSKDDDILFHQIQNLAANDYYPLAICTWRERNLVPAGWDEEIEQNVKIHFCKDLQKRFPASFWENINLVTLPTADDSAIEILERFQDQIDGLFNEDFLQLFEGLLNKAYFRRNLTKRHYDLFKDWLKEERQEMIDDVASKDLFSRDLYGVASRNNEGKVHYYLNASQKVIFEKQKKLQNSDELVTPIFYKKFWYNYDYRLEHVRNDFNELLCQIYNAGYFNILEEVDGLKINIDTSKFEEILNQYEKDKERDLLSAWRSLGKQWGLTGLDR